MATVNIIASSSGRLTSQNSDANYTTVHDDTIGSLNAIGSLIGQELVLGLYSLWRFGLIFDTSSILGGATITAATLDLYLMSKDITGSDFDLTIVSGADLNNPLVDADYYDLLDKTTSFGASTVSTMTAGAVNSISLNATGLAAINIGAGAITKLGLRSSRDISSTPPTGYEDLDIRYVTWSPEPTLTVTYTPLAGEGQGLIAIVSETLHYVSKTGVEYVIQGTGV